jgi:hypothetical protein
VNDEAPPEYSVTGSAALVIGTAWWQVRDVAQTGSPHPAANIALVPTVLLPVFLIGVAVAPRRSPRNANPCRGR